MSPKVFERIKGLNQKYDFKLTLNDIEELLRISKGLFDLKLKGLSVEELETEFGENGKYILTKTQAKRLDKRLDMKLDKELSDL